MLNAISKLNMYMINQELVYELKLPSFKDIVLPTFKAVNDDDKSINYLILYNIENFIKSEYCNLLNLDWYKMLYFKLSNSSGSIHTDINVTDPYKYLSDDICDSYFGINWISGGHGKIEFWDKCEVDVGNFVTTYNGLQVLSFVQKTLPSKSYIMEENKAYLVNVSYPHRATGSLNRKCYSMRTRTENRSWTEILKIFNKLIWDPNAGISEC